MTKNGHRDALGRRVPYLRVANVYANRLELGDVRSIGVSPPEIERAMLRRGDLLIVEGNGSLEQIGRVALWSGRIDPCVHQNHVIRARPHLPATGPWLLYWLLSPTGRSCVTSAASSTSGLHTLSLSKVEALPVVVAPAREQARIVAEIEKQFSRLDEAVATLEAVRAKLKRARASVLKAAVEGRLVPTEAELARTEGRSYEPGEVLLDRILGARAMSARRPVAVPRIPDGSRQPEGWTWASVEQLSAGDRRCAYGVLVPGDHSADGVPLIRVGDMENGSVDPMGLKRVAPSVAGRFPRTKLRGGEILLSLVGTIGRTAIVPALLAGGNVARAVGVLPIVRDVEASYVRAFLASPQSQRLLAGAAHEVARKTLNLEDVTSFAVGLPPLAEQARIVAEVERRLSVLDALDHTVEENLARCQRLRQSILKRAFEGKLVPQDPADEPASELLARIRRERAPVLPALRMRRAPTRRQRGEAKAR